MRANHSIENETSVILKEYFLSLLDEYVDIRQRLTGDEL
jgi:hypothetical protein